jgi:hypothetical protein
MGGVDPHVLLERPHRFGFQALPVGQLRGRRERENGERENET